MTDLDQFANVQIRGMVMTPAEVRYTPSGVPVASMSVSVRRARSGAAHTIDYLDVVVIGDEDSAQAENAVAFLSGQFVDIEGQLVMQAKTVMQGKTPVKKHRMVVKALSIQHCECAAV